jgi:hypothetical protein
MAVRGNLTHGCEFNFSAPADFRTTMFFTTKKADSKGSVRLLTGTVIANFSIENLSKGNSYRG